MEHFSLRVQDGELILSLKFWVLFGCLKPSEGFCWGGGVCVASFSLIFAMKDCKLRESGTGNITVDCVECVELHGLLSMNDYFRLWSRFDEPLQILLSVPNHHHLA